MQSSVRGKNTSAVEVTNIDAFGFWLLVRGKEYFQRAEIPVPPAPAITVSADSRK